MCRANAPWRLYPTVWVKGSGDETWSKIEDTAGGNSLYNEKKGVPLNVLKKLLTAALSWHSIEKEGEMQLWNFFIYW
jgi:hypothetical protein